MLEQATNDFDRPVRDPVARRQFRKPSGRATRRGGL